MDEKVLDLLQCEPIVYQFAANKCNDCEVSLIADIPVIIGLLIKTNPEEANSVLTRFLSPRNEIDGISVGFSVLHEYTDVLHETSSGQVRSILPDDATTSVSITESGVLVAFVSTLNIAKQFHHTPLQVVITMRMEHKQCMPFNERLISDQKELDIRLLMDLNRYRPQVAAERSVVTPVTISQPISVTFQIREVTSELTILTAHVRNLHNNINITVGDVVFHLDRICSTVYEEDPTAEDTCWLKDAFHFQLMNNIDNNNRLHNSAVVTIRPCEEYTFAYAITINGEGLNSASTARSNRCSLAETGFSAPCTVFWTVLTDDSLQSNKHTQDSIESTETARDVRSERGNDAARLPAVSEVLSQLLSTNRSNNKHTEQSKGEQYSSCSPYCEFACTAAWTVGSSFRDELAPSGSTFANMNPAGVSIFLTGPQQVCADEAFVLKVCIKNETAYSLPRASLGARSRYVYSVVVCSCH